MAASGEGEAVPPRLLDGRLRLRRVAEALGRADWTSVFIEFVVVTLGVLVAFQVEQWAGQRRERREERLYLERLWDDSAAVERQTLAYQRLHARTAAELARVYLARATPADGGVMCDVAVLPFAPLPSTYSELASTNRMDVIRDAALKSHLRRALGAHALASGQLSYFRQGMSGTVEDLSPYVEETLAPGAEDTGCEVDWAGLWSDRSARIALVSGVDAHRAFESLRGKEHAAVVAVRARLACVLDKPQCAA